MDHIARDWVIINNDLSKLNPYEIFQLPLVTEYDTFTVEFMTGDYDLAIGLEIHAITSTVLLVKYLLIPFLSLSIYNLVATPLIFKA